MGLSILGSLKNDPRDTTTHGIFPLFTRCGADLYRAGIRDALGMRLSRVSIPRHLSSLPRRRKRTTIFFFLKMKFSLLPEKFSLNFWRKKTEKKGKGAVEVLPPKKPEPSGWNFTQERKAKEIRSRIV